MTQPESTEPPKVYLYSHDLMPFMSGGISAYAMDPSGYQYEIQAVPMKNGKWAYRVLGTGQKRVTNACELQVFQMISKRRVPPAPRASAIPEATWVYNDQAQWLWMLLDANGDALRPRVMVSEEMNGTFIAMLNTEHVWTADLLEGAFERAEAAHIARRATYSPLPTRVPDDR